MTTQVRSRVLCVDDNREIGTALELLIGRTPGLEWAGWLESAERLPQTIAAVRPEIVLLDLDMPGPDVFEVLRRISAAHPEMRVVVFTGHVDAGLIDRASEAGAWGYVSKNDGEQALLQALRTVAGGQFALSPEAASLFWN